MALPSGLGLVFDKESYNAGDIVTVTLTGTGENFTTRTFSVTGVVRDAITGEESNITGDYTTASPAPLTGSVSEPSGVHVWSAQSPSQAGQVFSQVFTTVA